MKTPLVSFIIPYYNAGATIQETIDSIFNQSYPSKTLFSENLELNHLQSGVYLVNVQDGNKKEVKKIIVN